MTQDLRGFSLLEMAMAVGISGMVIAGIWQTTAGVQRQANAQQAASQLLSVAQAAQVAINNNKVAWLDTSTGPIAAVNAVACIKVTAADTCATAISDLQTLGVLPATAVAQNVYAQTYKFYIQRIDGGAPGADANDRIAGLVITTSGNDMDDDSGRMAAITIGAAGSYLPSDYAGTTTGTGGSWTLTLNAAPWSTAIGTDAAAGHLAVFLPMMPNAPTMGASVGASASKIDDLSDGVTVTLGSGTDNLFLGKNSGSQSTGATATTTGTTGVGYAALRDDTDGYVNSAFGYNAMLTTGFAYETTAFGSSAADCGSDSPGYMIALGSQAGKCVPTYGEGIIAIGHQSLMNNQGAGNTGIGFQAMLNMTTGAKNTAIGHSAFYTSSTDNYATAIGFNVMYKSNSGVALDVNANSSIGSSSLYNHTTGTRLNALGYQALYNTNDAVSDNAAGYNALHEDLFGNLNSALGSQALQSLNGDSAMGEALGNSAVGYRALASLTTGDYNVAIGDSALESNVIGGNTAIGYGSLNKNFDSGSTAYGSEALRYNVTGYNSAFGYQAAMGNAITAPAFMTATRNSAFGYQSMKALTSGTDNVALGYQSLMNVTSGSYNSVAGQNAGGFITTGSHNIGLGAVAIGNITTESNNIGIGLYAMFGMFLPVKGNNNIILGPNSLYSASPTDSTNTDNNIGIGSRVLQSLTLGTRNIAVGQYTGYQIKTGSDNILIGNTTTSASAGTSISRNIIISAGGTNGVPKPIANDSVIISSGDSFYNSPTGNYNTAVGNGIAGSATSAEGNTAAGALALYALTSGVYNTAIGYGAMSGGATSNYSTSIGSSSGGGKGKYNTSAGSNSLGGGAILNGNTGAGVNSGVAITTGNNNIAIGYGSGPTAAALNNTISLGYNAKASASNTVQVGDASVATISGQVAWSAISDRRDKHDITDTDLDESFIMALRPVSYRLNNGNGRLDLGFIAQEVEKALKGRITNMVIREHDQRRSYMLRATDMLSPIVKTVQQQDTRLQALRLSNDEIELKIATLKAEMAALEEITQQQNKQLADHGGTR